MTKKTDDADEVVLVPDPDSSGWTYRGGSLDGFRPVAIEIQPNNEFPRTALYMRLEKRASDSPGEPNQVSMWIRLDLRDIMAHPPCVAQVEAVAASMIGPKPSSTTP